MRTTVVNLMAVLVIVAGVETVHAANITRDTVGGNWSTVIEWDPNSLPISSDTAIHDAAFGTLTYDAGVPAPNRTIDRFEGTGGGSPPSRLQFAMSTTLNVLDDFYAIEGASSVKYQVTLPDSALLNVDGTIIGGRWFVQLDSEVTAGSIDPAEAAWTIEDNGIVTTTNDFVDAGTDDFGTLTVRDTGTLLVAPMGSGNLLISTINLEDSGTIDVADNVSTFTRITVDGGTLLADTVGADANDVGAGRFQIENDGTASIDGEVRINEDSSLEYGDISSAGNTLNAGSLNFIDAGSLIKPVSSTSAPSLNLTVSGDVNVVTDEASMMTWDSSGVDVTLDGSSAQSFEFFSTDSSAGQSTNGSWFDNTVTSCGDPCYIRPIKSLTVESSATVNFTDNNSNAIRGTMDSDTLYVDGDVTLESGATLNLGDLRIYYTGSLTDSGATIDEEDNLIHITRTCYGDFNGDGDVTIGDFATFSLCFAGPNNRANYIVADYDCDGDVDLSDFSVFSLAFDTGECPGPCESTESSSGSRSAEELAEWCLANLSTAEREEFAELLYATAEEMGETEVAAEMLDLADLIAE